MITPVKERTRLTGDVDQLEATERARKVPPVNINKGLLILRVLVGLLFIGHACQKAFGWFGGDGIQAWMATVQKEGFQPVALWAYLSIAAELGGGLLLALGLLTPLAAAVLIGDMSVAILKVHAPKGLWSQNGGFEYPLVLIALMIAFGLIGAGRYSVDRHLPVALPRPYTFLVFLALTLVLLGVAIAPTLGAPPAPSG
jgi:putative oxidoreductase